MSTAITNNSAIPPVTTTQRHLGQRVVSFSPKKCFVCLAVFEFNDQEYQAIRHSYMDIKVFNLLPVNERNKTMRLIVLMNKFVMSICKCKKKLAHLDCFNNYVDEKQGGNINMSIMCTQCNYEYEFDYSYNTPSLKTLDYFDYLAEMGSSLMTISLCVASTYWCSFSYSILTLVQIYGLEEGMQRLRGLNKLALFGLLPLVPMALVSARFIPWHDYFINMFPKYFNSWNESSKLADSSSSGSHFNYANSYSPHGQENMDDDESETRSCDQFLVMIRRIVGGLFVPTAAICIDRLILSKLNLSQSVLVRTTVAGIAFVSIKGAIKFTLLQRKISQQNCRDIQDYVHHST